MTDIAESSAITADSPEGGTLTKPLGPEVAESIEVSRDDIRFFRLNEDPNLSTQLYSPDGGSEPIEAEPPRLQLFPPYSPTPSESFIAVARWRGSVVQVNGASFTARLFPVSGGEPEKAAEINIEEVSEEDRRLIREGAVFYWSIGYLDKLSGTRIKASILRFRRSPDWSERKIAEARRQADRYRFLLDSE